VIYYHGVAGKDIPSFKRQMAYLVEHCSVVEPSKIMTACPNGARSIVAITFDDAFLSVFENAVPVLKEYGLPAGIFVPAGCLGRPPSWAMPETSGDKDEVLMSERLIAGLDKDGFEIFSHTVSHPVLTDVGAEALESELIDSKDLLEEMLGHEVVAISYPYGAHDLKTCSAAQKAGYRLGFTIEPCAVDGSTDPMRIGRLAVSPKDSLLSFKLKVRGAYGVVGFLGAMRRRIRGAFP
jgi:peptidoglycan/xylan/chitin deacetylase (PgdA/CDA1 family)